MRLKRRRKAKYQTTSVGLDGLSANLRGFLALGNLCAAAAVISGVQQERVSWLRDNLNSIALLKRYQFSVAEAVVTLLPLLQQQLKNKVDEKLLSVIENIKLPVIQQTILWHQMGNFLLSQEKEKLAGQYFLKAKKQLDRHHKLRQAIADRYPQGKHHIEWALAGEGKALSLDHAREYHAVANYYLDTARKLGHSVCVDQLSDFSRQLEERL